MRIESQITYPGARAKAVSQLIFDPDFRAAVCEATAALDYDVEVHENGDGWTTVRIHRVLPAEVPDFVKKLVGETIDVTQTEEWGAPDESGRRTADLLLEIKGQPARMTGSIVLEADEAGVTEQIEGDLKVSIPLLGRKIEPEIAKGVLLAVKVEQKTGREWLESR
jgi:hypothetical protein